MLQQKTRIRPILITKTSKNFRKFFLLQFTRELIKHSAASEVLELEGVIKERKNQEKEKIKRIIKEKEERSFLHREPVSLVPILRTKKKIIPLVPRQITPAPRHVKVLKVPRPQLPPRFQYLKPVPTNIQIDLGKLNPLVNDPMLNTIECNGAGQNIVVKGHKGTKKTNIILNKEEINQIIKKFSEKAKIPIHEGIFKVAVGKLILTAIISEVVSSRFIIKKIRYAPQTRVFR